tara:strand:- start:2852 stop:3274 length:423 start_codon:yes stop_codon:yes gene_type:complete
MNLIEVNGGNKTQREICQKVVHHMISKLLSRFRTLDITVNLVNIKSEAIGFCMMEDKNQFEIELDKKLSIKDMVTALCHEMVHVKQFARKEMVDGVETGVARWKSKTIPLDTNYWDLPWEKEAYRMEKKLANSVWENGVI